MKILILLLLTCQFTFLSGCSPFGGSSVINIISEGISDFFAEKHSGVTSGATQYGETDPNDPTKNFKVNYSFAEPVNLNAVETANGFKIDGIGIK